MTFPHKNFSKSQDEIIRVSVLNSINCHTCSLEQSIRHADFNRFLGLIKRLTRHQKRLLTIENNT